MKKTETMLHKIKTVPFDLSSWYTVLIGTVLVWILSSIQPLYDAVTTHRNMVALLLVILYLTFCAHIVFKKGKKDTQTILGLLLLGGLLLRSYYVLVTPYDITIHDSGSFRGLDTDETAGGHFGYIDYLFKNHALPDFDPRERWSFYNPPGFHALGAVVLGISRLFRVPEPMCYETLQVITLCFSNLTVWTGVRILKEFAIKDKWLLLSAAFLSVHPFFAVMAVTLTNDCMAMYFMMLAVWYTIRWQNHPELKKIVVIALAVGLGMMTKLNAGLLAFAIGTVFLYVFVKNRREWKKFILQFVLFLVICAPLGLFSPARNMINYDMPLAYVQQVDTSDWKYMEDATFFSMFGLPPLEQMSSGFVTLDPGVDRNAWIQVLKTALYDELMPELGNSLFGACALALLWVSIVLAILMNAAFIFSICKRHIMKIETKLLCAITYVTLLVSFMSFCLKEPFTFTMEYRYISIALLFPLLGAALWLKNGSDHSLFQKKKSMRILKSVLIYGMVLFMVLAVIIHLDLIAWSNTFL